MDEKSAEQKTPFPLRVMVRNARAYLNDSVDAIMQCCHLPPYIMDGLICEVLAELRKHELNETAQIQEQEDRHEQQHISES